MPAKYSKHDLIFFFLDNWTLEEEQNENAIDITLQSPDGAVWSLNIQDETATPDQLAEETLRALRKEYAELEASPAAEVIEGVSQVGFDIDFFLLDFLVTCSIRAFRVGDRTFCVFCEAESREFDALKEVHRAVTFSLLKSLQGESIS